MKLLGIFSILIAVAGVAGNFGGANAKEQDYFGGVLVSYTDFFVAEVESASVIRAPSGFVCFFKYETNVVENVGGRFSANQKFDFYSDVPLKVGVSYLVYYSMQDEGRFRMSYGRSEDANFCRGEFHGLLMKYYEVHELENVTVGDHLERFVKFSDPMADVIGPVHDHTDSVHEYQFDYIKQILSHPLNHR